MAINSINTNTAALQAMQALNNAGDQVVQAEQVVSSGLKVSSPKDDGATWSIAQNMRSEIADWQAVAQSLNGGQSILDVAANGANQIGDLLAQLKAKALSYSDTSLDTVSRTSLQSDMTALIHQIDQTADNASFEGVDLLNPPMEVTDFTPPSGTVAPSFTFSTPMNGTDESWSFNGSTVNTDSYSFQTTFTENGNTGTLPPQPVNNSDVAFGIDFGAGATSSSITLAANPPSTDPPPSSYGLTFSSVTYSQTAATIQVNSDPNGGKTAINYQPLTSDALGLDALDWTDPSNVVTAINNAASMVTNASLAIGSQQNMLTSQLTQASNMQNTLTTGVGNLVDANMGEESAKLTAAQSKQQLAAKALAIANAVPQLILSLFR